MPSDLIKHSCPVDGLVMLEGRWLPAARQLHGKCDVCDSAVYASRKGEQQNAVSLETEVR
jgi:hypothetical protein